MNEPSPNSADTGELLDRYRMDADGIAFAELVRRYSGLVLGTALRSLGNDAALAEEAAQNAFIQLARNAGGLSSDAALGGWLHRVTRRIASNLRRGETRRRIRESTMPPREPDHNSEEWRKLAPVLDAALERLAEADRAPVIMRFFENKSAREMAILLQLSEEAAKKRLQRSLEKLRRLIGKRGVTFSAAVLPALLAAGVVLSPEPGRAESWAATALASPPVAPVLPGPGTSGLSLPVLGGAAAALLAGLPFLWMMDRDPLPGVVPGVDAIVPRRGGAGSSPSNGDLFEPLPGGAVEDILAALERVARGPAHALSRWRMEAIAARAALASIPDLLDQARARHILSGKDAILRTLLKRWAAADPVAALDYVRLRELDRQRNPGYAWPLFTTWAQKDPRAAAQWLADTFTAPGLQGGTGEGARNAKMAACVLELLSDRSPAEAIAFAEKLPAGDARTRALEGLAGDSLLEDWRTDWSREKRESFANSLAEARDGPLSGEPLRRYLARWARRDEAAVQAWLEKQTDPAVRLESALALLAVRSFEVPAGPNSYGMEDVTDRKARAAAALAASAGILPPEQAVARIAAAWPDGAPELGAWLLAIRNTGVNVDQALVLAAARLLPYEHRPQPPPLPAFACAEEISDAGLREQVVSGLFRRWRANNPGAAATFLDSAGWSPGRVAWLKSVTIQNP